MVEASPKHGPSPNPVLAHRIGGWLPNEPTIIREHVNHILDKAKKHDLSFVQPILDLQALIHDDPVVYMLFNEMLTEVPIVPPYDQDPSLQPEIRDVDSLLKALNYQIQSPIKWNDSPQIGTPINAILDWPMGTKAGFAVFTRQDVNAIFQRMLQHWGDYLKAPANITSVDTSSIATVTIAEKGWLSPEAQNDPKCPGLANFLDTYIVPDPQDPHYGFKTWDEFFTRRFKEHKRPLPEPPNDDVIVSGTESTPFFIQHDVQLEDTFWVKNKDWRTNYSLAHMLGDKELAKQFVGGTVYQAFLSADSYHNWHAPVAGKYLEGHPPRIIPGTYYSEPLMWGFDPDDKNNVHPDDGADALSQSYISAVAARGVAFIEATNPKVGLMALVMIGMAEVSSIEFDHKPKGFAKGEEIGRFHFGGSTHCLVFRPGVKLEFAQDADPSQSVFYPGARVPVLSELARVVS